MDAWTGAFRDLGLDVSRSDVERQIGKGGDNLVPSLIGAERATLVELRLGSLRGQRFQRLVETEGVGFLRGARSVLTEAKAYRYRTAIVTSATSGDLAIVERALGVRLSNLVDALVTGDDAASTKPAPDLVTLGCNALHLHPSRCIVVGDSVFDGVAACRAGAMFMGVRTGYASRTELADAGARVILKNLEILSRGVVEILSSLGAGALTISDRP